MQRNLTFKKIIGNIVLVTCVICNVQVAHAQDDIVIAYKEWDNELKTQVYKLSDEYDLDEALILAVIYNESRFQSGLTNHNNNGTVDYGLMQVNEVNYEFLHSELGINSMTELLNDEVGLKCGVHILAYCKSKTGNDSLAVLMYQNGIGAYNRLVGSGRYTTKNHTRVMKWRDTIADYLKDVHEKELNNGLKLIQFIPPYITLRAKALSMLV